MAPVYKKTSGFVWPQSERALPKEERASAGPEEEGKKDDEVAVEGGSYVPLVHCADVEAESFVRSACAGITACFFKAEELPGQDRWSMMRRYTTECIRLDLRERVKDIMVVGEGYTAVACSRDRGTVCVSGPVGTPVRAAYDEAAGHLSVLATSVRRPPYEVPRVVAGEVTSLDLCADGLLVDGTLRAYSIGKVLGMLSHTGASVAEVMLPFEAGVIHNPLSGPMRNGGGYCVNRGEVAFDFGGGHAVTYQRDEWHEWLRASSRHIFSQGQEKTYRFRLTGCVNSILRIVVARVGGSFSDYGAAREQSYDDLCSAAEVTRFSREPVDYVAESLRSWFTPVLHTVPEPQPFYGESVLASEELTRLVASRSLETRYRQLIYAEGFDNPGSILEVPPFQVDEPYACEEEEVAYESVEAALQVRLLALLGKGDPASEVRSPVDHAFYHTSSVVAEMGTPYVQEEVPTKIGRCLSELFGLDDLVFPLWIRTPGDKASFQGFLDYLQGREEGAGSVPALLLGVREVLSSSPWPVRWLAFGHDHVKVGRGPVGPGKSAYHIAVYGLGAEEECVASSTVSVGAHIDCPGDSSSAAEADGVFEGADGSCAISAHTWSDHPRASLLWEDAVWGPTGCVARYPGRVRRHSGE